jgi:hypothetical protein
MIERIKNNLLSNNKIIMLFYSFFFRFSIIPLPPPFYE